MLRPCRWHTWASALILIILFMFIRKTNFRRAFLVNISRCSIVLIDSFFFLFLWIALSDESLEVVFLRHLWIFIFACSRSCGCRCRCWYLTIHACHSQELLLLLLLRLCLRYLISHWTLKRHNLRIWRCLCQFRSLFIEWLIHHSFSFQYLLIFQI